MAPTQRRQHSPRKDVDRLLWRTLSCPQVGVLALARGRRHAEARTIDDEREGTMHMTGPRLGILCVALIILSACAGPEASSPDLRTPPAREAPAPLGTGAGTGAGAGASGVG